ncbi:MAG: cytidine deaminase [Gammaproteobacteria bacterium]
MSHDSALFERARRAAANAYSPYSGVRVGAAVETTDGSVFTGCNVENASYGLTLCAERVALVAMAAAGQRNVARIAVCVIGPEGGDARPVPCGACLQFLAEFADDDTPIVTGTDSVTALRDHLPLPFRLSPCDD